VQGLKVRNGESEAVNRRRSDNSMTKRKWNNDVQNTLYKTKD